MLRAFIAIQLSADLKRQIRELQAEWKRQTPELVALSWVHPEGIHLTLRFLGDMADEQVEAITGVLRQAAAPERRARRGYFSSAVKTPSHGIGGGFSRSAAIRFS